MLRFRIGQWEVGYFCEQTFKQTNIRLYYIDLRPNINIGSIEFLCNNKKEIKIILSVHLDFGVVRPTYFLLEFFDDFGIFLNPYIWYFHE